MQIIREQVVVEANGISLPVLIQRSGDAAPGGVVICCPGGLGKGDFEIFAWLASALPAAGFTAVILSWRASSPLDDPADVSMVVDWLGSQSYVDTGRIAVMGQSRGGNAALRAAALDQRIKLCLTFGAATNFLQQVNGAALYAPSRYQMLVKWLGDPVADRAFYERVQAINYAGRIRQPVLLIHGLHDMHAVPEQSISMKESIEAGGNQDVQIRLIPMMGHYGELVPNRYGFDLLLDTILPYLRQRL